MGINRRTALAAATAFALVASLMALLGPVAAARTSTSVVPASIDPTGSRDVTSELAEFFRGVPDGSTVTFPPASTYRIEGSIILADRHGLTIDGTGATFVVTTDGTNATEGQDHSWWGRNWPRKRGQFILKGGSGYTISNLTIAGPNAKAGPTNEAFVVELEAQHGIEFFGTTDSTVENCHIHHTYGDLISVSGASDNITVRGCNLHHSGRQGVTVDEATNVTVTGNTIADIGRSAIDLEPARSDWIVEHITIADNTIGRANGVFVAAHGNGPVNHITIDGNSLVSEEMKVLVNDSKGLLRHHWTITDNSTDKIEGSPLAPLRFNNVDHITITGNHQPIASTQGRIAVAATGTTTATITDNHFPIHDTTDVPTRPPTGEAAIITVNGTEHTQPIHLPESAPVDETTPQEDPIDEIPSEPRPGSASAAERFVDAVYRDFLRRPPSTAELDRWRGSVATAHDRRELVQMIGYSDAWVGAIVDGFYVDTFGRPADTSGRSHWIHRIRSAELTPSEVASAFYASAEYFADAGGGSVAGWIDQLYLDLLDRPADPDGRRHWGRVAAHRGRSAVTAAFYNSPETLGTRVDALYLALLDRPADPGGRAHWARVIRSTGNDVDLAVRLASSEEYFVRASR